MDYILHRDALESLYENLNAYINSGIFQKKNLVMFGTSKISGMIIHYLSIHGIKITGIIDNDRKRQGKMFCGKLVDTPEEYVKNNAENICVMIASSYQDEMIRQLESFGLVYGENIIKIIDLPKLMKKTYYINEDNSCIMTEKDIKETQLQILKYLKKICQENHLKYFLCGGTLLGAARHQGFIPWDDDIDVFLELNDLMKLNDLLKNDKRYRLISMFDNNGYFDECSLLVDLNTVCDMNRFPMQITTGVSIDIFMLSGLPSGTDAVAVMDQAKELEMNCYNTLYSAKEHKDAVKKLITCLQQHDFNSSPQVAHVLGRFMYREITQKKYFNKTAELLFENEYFSCPCGWDEYLTDIYGDYMKLPPEEQRTGHHYFKAYYK